MTALPDIVQTATLYNGKPTCFFPSQPFHRVITNIVVANSVASSVQIFRGTLGSIPIASNPTGNNTVTGRLSIPAGQQFFIVWSAAAPNVADATARVSLESGDPLDQADSATWTTNPVTSLVLPTGHDPNTGSVIVLDGTTGVIRVIGTNGSRIEIDPNNVTPKIEFYSPDGTNDAFINLVSGAPGVADLGINSGKFVPGGSDLVTRRWRIYANDSANIAEIGMIREATQQLFGGSIRHESTAGFYGYTDYAGGVDNNLLATANGLYAYLSSTNHSRALTTNNVTLNGIPSASWADPTPGAWTNIANYAPTFAKEYDAIDTDLKVCIQMSGYTTVANDIWDIGVGVSGNPTVEVIQRWKLNTASQHMFAAGTVRVPNLPHGTYTITVQARRLSGTGILNHDIQDSMSMDITEVGI